MRTSIVVFAALVLLLGVVASATDNYFYYHDEQISLTAVQEYVVAKADPDQFTTWTTIIGGSQALSGDFSPFPMADGFTLLGVNSGYEAEAVVEELRQTSGVLFANKVYVDNEGGYFYPTDLLYLHFVPTVSDAQIDSLMSTLALGLVDSR